jgi:transposase
MMIRLYPTNEQEQTLISIENDLRSCWNWLVGQTEEVLKAREAYATRYGLVGPRPVRPNYDGMEPDESKAAKEAHYQAVCQWKSEIHTKTNELPGCSWRPSVFEMVKFYGCKYDYQLLQRITKEWYAEKRPEGALIPCAHAFQALVKNFIFSGKAADGSGRARGQRRKRFRKKDEAMPLQVRSGSCFELGNFGARGGNHPNQAHPLKPYYNCRVSFNGMKILGRLPAIIPDGKLVEGVSITKQADGWWASIKQQLPIRQLSPAVPGSVAGIDVGLDCLAAISDGTMAPAQYVSNPREKIYAERIAGRQSMGKPVGRLQQRAARDVRHRIYNQVVKPLAIVETIKVERLTGRIGQMGSRMTSSMRMTTRILKERYSTRVREVECAYTSQDCSQCGHRSKESWSYENGKVGQCPKCGHRENRDGNASRNIALKDPIPLDL